MTDPTKQPETIPVAGLDDFFGGPKEVPPVILDRSTLERYANCQLAGWAVETDRVLDAGKPADSGSEAHRVIAEGVAEYAASGVPPREYMEAEMLKVRPDVQADVVDALKRAIWPIDNWLTDRHPHDLILYQGGVAERSGQLARELLTATTKRGPIIATSEVDLVVAGPTEVELFENDWKTGRTVWDSTKILNSFQFQFHSWLLFGNYPELEILWIRVYMTRFREATPWVKFRRRDADRFEGRLYTALQHREQAFKLAAEGNEDQIECWCDAESILTCPALHLSPRLKSPMKDLAKDPRVFAVDTLRMESALADRKKMLRQYVDKHGDLVGKGVAFGLQAPRTPQKPRANSYVFYTPPEARSPGEEIQDELAEQFKKPDPVKSKAKKGVAKKK